MLKTYKAKVEKILKDYPKARDYDSTLIAIYVAIYHKRLVQGEGQDRCIRLADFKHLPNFESIRRSRQIIQNNDGKYPPTKESVIKARNIKERNWREAEVREAKGVDNSFA